MSRIKITATDAGFFNIDPLANPLAPNVFLKTAVNLQGVVETTPDGWQSVETDMYPDFGVDLVAKIPEDGRLGQQIEVTFSEITYFRMVEGEKTVIGTLSTAQPLMVTAIFDELSTGETGWSADLGAVLNTHIQTQGFKFRGGDADDIFAPHQEILPSYADTSIRGRGGDDQLSGGLGNDDIRGGTGDDTLFDPDGHNFLNGQSGNDSLTLGDGSDESIAKGGNGNDVLISGNGHDTLRGGNGHDHLSGGAGNDRLYGGNGDDTLVAGNGDDFLKGNAGADVFVFNTEDRGRNVIVDFTDALDQILLSHSVGYDSLDVQQQGDDTLLTFAHDHSLTLQNFDAGLLDANDFIFV